MTKKFFLRVSDRAQGINDAAAAFRAGQHRHDVLVQMARVLELDPSDESVGYGGVPNILGDMELDGAFMDGNTRSYAAVAGLKHCLPVRVARRLMEEKLHTVLVGAGADSFARECGFEAEPLLHPSQKEKWERDVKPLLDGKTPLMHLVRKMAAPNTENFDTSISIGSDGNGISGAATTSGWPYKYPGRAGDTPISGAGLYVDSRYGACCCTWTGEMSTRAGTSRLVVAQLQDGKTIKQAVHAAIEDVASLQEGVLRTLVIHGIDTKGQEHVVALNADQPTFYQYWHEDLVSPERRAAEMITLHPGNNSLRPRFT